MLDNQLAKKLTDVTDLADRVRNADWAGMGVQGTVQELKSAVLHQGLTTGDPFLDYFAARGCTERRVQDLCREFLKKLEASVGQVVIHSTNVVRRVPFTHSPFTMYTSLTFARIENPRVVIPPQYLKDRDYEWTIDLGINRQKIVSVSFDNWEFGVATATTFGGTLQTGFSPEEAARAMSQKCRHEEKIELFTERWSEILVTPDEVDLWCVNHKFATDVRRVYLQACSFINASQTP